MVSKINAGVVDSNPTLEFGATSQVGSVDGVPLRVTMPADPTADFFIRKEYTAEYSVSGSAFVQIKANQFTDPDGEAPAPPDGYVAICAFNISSGNSHIAVAAYNPAATGAGNLLVLRNCQSTDQTGTATVRVLYAKREMVNW